MLVFDPKTYEVNAMFGFKIVLRKEYIYEGFSCLIYYEKYRENQIKIIRKLCIFKLFNLYGKISAMSL